MSNPQEALSGQQVQALQKQLADKMASIVKDVEIRKWAVDQAVGLAGAQLEAEVKAILHPVELAREIHKFLTEAASQTT